MIRGAVGLSDRQIDSLLARGDLSGAESDRILENVLNRRAHRPLWRRLLVPAGGSLTLATAAVLLLVAGPWSGRKTEEFSARGTGVAHDDLDVACMNGSRFACPRGSTLLFAAREGAPSGYLAAWAEPARGGERIWYFSAEGEVSRIAPPATGTQPLSRGIRIGPEHSPGEYRVHLVVSATPLGKAELLSASPPGVLLRQELTLVVTEGPAP
jgi:hypothetical protein